MFNATFNNISVILWLYIQYYKCIYSKLRDQIPCSLIIDLIFFGVFNATFSNISAISWQPVLMVEEAGVPGENHRPWASNW